MASGLCNTLILWVKMRADNNHPHQLFAYVQGRSYMEARGGPGPPKPQNFPLKKKKFLNFLVLPPLFFFFSIWPLHFYQPRSATAYVDVVIKIHYPHMRMMIAVFKYVNVINNRTRIAFIYNIYFIYLIKFTQKNSF